mmetsp:Transcript_28597/g.72468  ORF Transcript_28597/g.72468 Transcript_28597/m.72468 type:complete len:213 (-) Transcript_28597:3169-3807(-)
MARGVPGGCGQRLRALVRVQAGGGARGHEARHFLRLYGGGPFGHTPHPRRHYDAGGGRPRGGGGALSRLGWRRRAPLLQFLRGLQGGPAAQDPQGARAPQQRPDQGGDGALHLQHRRHPRPRVPLRLFRRLGCLRLCRGGRHGHGRGQPEGVRLYRLLIRLRRVICHAWVRGGAPPRLPRAGGRLLPAGRLRHSLRKTVLVRKPPRAPHRVH